MRYYSYNELIKDLRHLSKKLENQKIDAILALSRGGLTAAHLLAEKFKIKMLFAMNVMHYKNQKKLDEVVIYNVPDLKDTKNILVVDEIIDSGETMQEVMRILNEKYQDKTFQTLALFQKKDACFKADFWAQTTDEWIEFCWEKDLND